MTGKIWGDGRGPKVTSVMLCVWGLLASDAGLMLPAPTYMSARE